VERDVEHFVQPGGLPPNAGYSHALAVTGRLVLVSGQIPMGPDGQVTGPGDAEAQLRQVFANLATALAAAGASLGQVVKLTVYLTDRADLPVFRRVRDEVLPEGPPPASTLVYVAGLVHPDMRVEIEALAAT
jgi:enamine deaminase RidA (YjgF/YER057c/UK114 family)